MADSKVIFEVVVEGKNIKVVQKQVQDLGKSIDKTSTSVQNTAKSHEKSTTALRHNAGAMEEANKATQHHNRGQKGVAGATANSTKAFSKQRDAISGSSGLVGAYATLAANMFAATALFNAFRGAAQVEQLRAGMTALGYESGLAMKTISDGLVAATDNAISLEQAMRSTVQITSAGLDPSAVIRFGEAARNASIALGRNLTDTIDRLTRGVTKLEPELLDELGIFIRIDEVTAQYAATVGKTTSQLTSFEKRIAFQDAALKQLEEKFTAVGESVDVNVYDKLGAAFVNLGNNMAKTAAGGLRPIIDYLSQSPTALLGVLTLLGGKVIKQAISSFKGFKISAEDSQRAFARLQTQIQDHISEIGPLTEREKAFNKAMQEGTVGFNETNAAIAGVKQRLAGYKGELTKSTNELNKLQNEYRAGKISLKDYQEGIKKVSASQAKANANIALGTVGNKLYNQTLAQLNIQQGLANYELAQGAIAAGRWGEALKLAKLGLTDQIAGIKLLRNNLTNLSSRFTLVATTARVASSALKLVGIAFLSAIPLIGAVITAFTLLFDGVKSLVNAFKTDEQKAFEKQLSSMESTMEELEGTFRTLNSSIDNNSAHLNGIIARYEALGNSAKQAKADLEKLSSIPGADFEEVVEQYDKLFENSKDLQKAYEAVKKESGFIIVSDAQRLELQKQALDNTIRASDEVRSLESAGQAVNKAFTDLRNSVKIKNDFTEAANSLETLVAGLETAKVSLQKVGDQSAEAAAKTIEATLNSIPDTGVLLQVGIDAESIKNLEDARKNIDNLNKRKKFLENERDSLGFFKMTKHAKELNLLLRETEKAIRAAGLAGEGLSENLAKQVAARQKALRDAEAALALDSKKLEIQDQVISQLKENTSLSESSTRALVSAENQRLEIQKQINNAKIIELEGTIRGYNEALSASKKGARQTTEHKAAELELRKLQAEQLALSSKMTGEYEVQVQLAKNKQQLLEDEQKNIKAVLDLAKKQIDYARSVREQQASLIRGQIELNALRQGRDLDYKEQILLAKIERDNAIKAAKEEAAIKRIEIQLEYAVIDARFALLDAELKFAASEGRITTQRAEALSSALKAAQNATITIPEDPNTDKKEALLALQLDTARQAGRITEATYQSVTEAFNALQNGTISVELQTSGTVSQEVNDTSISQRYDLLNTEKNSALEIAGIVEGTYNSISSSLLEITQAMMQERPEDPSIAQGYELLKAKLAVALKIKGMDDDSINNLMQALKVPQAKTLQESALTTVDQLEEGKIKQANIDFAKAEEIAARQQFEREVEYANALAGMYEANGSIRMGQIIQEGEALVGIYRQVNESATATDIRRSILKQQLIKAEAELQASYDAESNTYNTQKLTEYAKIRAEQIALETAETAKQISLVESISAMYEAAGRERVALTVKEGAIRLKIEEAIARVRAGGDAAALAELNNLYAQLAGLKEEQGKLLESIATRVGGEQAGQFASLNTAAQVSTQQGGAFDPDAGGSVSEKLATLAKGTENLRKGLEEIGGDGPLIASVINGAFNISEAWALAAESLSQSATTWQEKMAQGAAVASAVGATITAIGGIQSAASDQRVAALQAEIEAEKKRDGVTKESKARIAALEAKAEKEKRKAFERDKKTKMAATVMNTAASIMSNMAAPWPSNFIFAAMAAVMGAAQLAAIASTSYQGGGSSAPSGPTSISLGERTSTVDVATSKSISGELAYMRGEQGVGGIGDFRPAFTGARYRATGGATTGYVVGEQGPELFVPNTPGLIVPNDEFENTPTQNVSFTINAVDAEGVENLLTKQKGSIIRMIREAANSYGTPFLEEVNVGLYTPKAQGAGRA